MLRQICLEEALRPNLATASTTIAPADPVLVSEKYSWTNWASMNGGTGYTFYMRNDGNVPLTNVVQEDAIPDKFYMSQIGLGYDDNGTQSNFTVEYQTNTNGSWQTWPGSPFTVPANPAMPDRKYLSPWDLGFDPNAGPVFVTDIRITMDNVPVGYMADNASTYISGSFRNPDKLGNTYTLPMTVDNTLNTTYDFNGNTTPLTYTDPLTLRGNSPKPVMSKYVNNGYNQQPGGQVEYVMCSEQQLGRIGSASQSDHCGPFAPELDLCSGFNPRHLWKPWKPKCYRYR